MKKLLLSIFFGFTAFFPLIGAPKIVYVGVRDCEAQALNPSILSLRDSGEWKDGRLYLGPLSGLEKTLFEAGIPRNRAREIWGKIQNLSRGFGPFVVGRFVPIALDRMINSRDIFVGVKGKNALIGEPNGNFTAITANVDNHYQFIVMDPLASLTADQWVFHFITEFSGASANLLLSEWSRFNFMRKEQGKQVSPVFKEFFEKNIVDGKYISYDDRLTFFNQLFSRSFADLVAWNFALRVEGSASKQELDHFKKALDQYVASNPLAKELGLTGENIFDWTQQMYMDMWKVWKEGYNEIRPGHGYPLDDNPDVTAFSEK